MDVGVIVAIVGIAVSVGTYFLGKRHGSRTREEDKSEARIMKFVEDYVDRHRRHINTGITALVPCGVTQLETDREIREALEICGSRLGKHPLGRGTTILESVDLKEFFEFVARERINFAMVSVEQALDHMHSESHQSAL